MEELWDFSDPVSIVRRIGSEWRPYANVHSMIEGAAARSPEHDAAVLHIYSEAVTTWSYSCFDENFEGIEPAFEPTYSFEEFESAITDRRAELRAAATTERQRALQEQQRAEEKATVKQARFNRKMLIAIGIAAAIIAAVAIGRETNGETPSAECMDGTISYSKTASGTCSWHGGVRSWISGSDDDLSNVESDYKQQQIEDIQR